MKEKAFQLHINSNGIARLTFDLKEEKVNKLSSPVMEEFSSILDELSVNASIKILILDSAKRDVFIAGADIKEIENIHKEKDAIDKIQKGHEIFHKLSNQPFPSIALIDGVCLGGGLELALACTYRIVTDHPKTSLGLPEVSLGILPAWGGTQRLPKLVGLIESLQMILTGKPISARKAWKIRLADAIFPREFKKQETEKFAYSCLEDQGRNAILKRRQNSGIFSFLLEKNPIGRRLVYEKTKRDLIKKTKGHYPAPLKALKTINETFSLDLEEGLEKEIHAFAKLSCTRISKNLIKLFFTGQELKKDPGSSFDLKDHHIFNTAIVGAGTMGGGIAWLLSNKDHPVRLKDLAWDAITAGYEKAQDYYSQIIKRKKIKPSQANLKMHLISGTTDYSGFQNADILFEAIVENLDSKKKLFCDVENHIKKETLVCSNTSSLSISQMGQDMRFPERFLGMHFFNPVNRMPLVEIIPGEKTSPETIAKAVAFTKHLGKTPIVVSNCPGFLVNRILLPYINEALFMFEEGIDVERVDKLIVDFGMPMGPFTLIDQIGIDVAYSVAKILEDSYGQRMKSAKLTQKLYEQNIKGKKSGKGFYIYNGKQKKPNKALRSILQENRVTNPLIDDKIIVDRMIHMMINEASMCLEEKVIENVSYLDMAMILGTGFPPFRGGLLRYADELFIKNVVNKLKQLSMEYGKRFTPSNLLTQMNREQKTFYPNTDTINT